MKEFDMIKQLKDLQVVAVFNLEEPGEHPLCGDGLVSDQIGFSYDPEIINNAGIAFFNSYWQDLKITSYRQIMNIVQQMDYHIQKNKGNKVLVHCHAGMGRTAIVIAAYLAYAGIAKDGQEAITLFKQQRPGALSNKLSASNA